MNNTILDLIAVLDQATLTLLELPRTPARELKVPQSFLFTMVGISKRFQKSPNRLGSQARLVVEAGLCVFALAKAWKRLMREPLERPVPARHFYRVGSLAAASLLIPWILMQRKRPITLEGGSFEPLPARLDDQDRRRAWDNGSDQALIA